MKNSIILFTFSLLLISCKKETPLIDKPKEIPVLETETKSEKDTIKNTVKLETFGFPQEVEGCSCYFAENRAEFIKQNYIYVDDFQKNSFIKINGNQIKLEYLKENEVLPEKDLNIKAKNKDYSVAVIGKKVEDGEIETALYEGKIILENSKGEKSEFDFYGECGC